jgi:putative peptide zinc metalloprotease protein
MLQLRPTFSESWYRVVGLKPKLRFGAQMSRQFYRGERWYVVRDPAGNQFHRVSDAAYRFLGLLDGRRTVGEAWDLVGGQLADDAPTQPEVIQILSQLYAANLLETNITPDATVLLRRHKQQAKQKMQNRLMNVLFPRIPIWDPDQFLLRWMPVLRTLFSKVGAIIWLIVVGLAIATLLPHWNDLMMAGRHALDMQHNWENIFWLYFTFVLIKLFHELGHAGSCRRFGGECHELGIMLLVLVPTPYVDASTAWAFSNKWHRIFVGAAGMIVELFLAAICAFIWVNTNPQNYPLVNQLAYNAMFIASVSTILFNANPLLRYDGYYILSDSLEIPNFRQKSSDYALGLIKRHVFRLKLPQPLPPLVERAWLLSYAIASSIYRIFIGVMIVVVVSLKIPILGILMAFGGVATWLIVPVVKVVKYLSLDPELHRKRPRAIAFSAVIAAIVLITIGLIRFPVYVKFAGVVQPDDPVDLHGFPMSGDLKTGGEGRVTRIFAKDGQIVHAGDPIIQLTNPMVEHDLEAAIARVNEINARIRQSRGIQDLSELAQDEADLSAWQDRLSDSEQRQADLTVKAPFTGYLVSPRLNELPDQFLMRGTEVGRVAVLDRLIVKGDIEQDDAELVQPTRDNNAPVHISKVEIRLASIPSQSMPGQSVIFLPAAVTDVVDPVLGTAGGGDIMIDPHDPKGLKAESNQFEAHVKLDNANGQYYAGQRAYVRLTLDKEPLLWQWTRRFLQMIETSDTGRWL